MTTQDTFCQRLAAPMFNGLMLAYRTQAPGVPASDPRLASMTRLREAVLAWDAKIRHADPRFSVSQLRAYVAPEREAVLQQFERANAARRVTAERIAETDRALATPATGDKDADARVLSYFWQADAAQRAQLQIEPRVRDALARLGVGPESQRALQLVRAANAAANPDRVAARERDVAAVELLSPVIAVAKEALDRFELATMRDQQLASQTR